MAGISMKELAAALGVSTASVSVALRGKPGISEETRGRILAEARKQGYDMSRLSAVQTKGVIAIVDYTYYGCSTSPKDTFSYYSQFVDGAAVQITKKGYTPAGPFSPMEFGQAQRDGADGYIILGGGMSNDQLMQYRQGRVPFVVAGNGLEELPVTTVSHDNYYGIFSVLEHLNGLGHRKIGYIRSLCGNAGLERFMACKNGSARLGLDFSDFLDVSDQEKFMDAENIIKGIERWIGERQPKATAFVCDNDFAAASLMRVMRSCHQIPGKDIAVTGFDDQPFSTLLEPPLTSVHTFEPELAAVCVEELVYNIENPGARFRHVRIGTELIVRSSTVK